MLLCCDVFRRSKIRIINRNYQIFIEMSTFTGFSEEDLKRIKNGHVRSSNDNTGSRKKIIELPTGSRRVIIPPKIQIPPKSSVLEKQPSNESIDNIQFDKCKLSIKAAMNEAMERSDGVCANENTEPDDTKTIEQSNDWEKNIEEMEDQEGLTDVERKNSLDFPPDIVRGMVEYTEDKLVSHHAKMEELQLKQKLMEEQNKKRKEMLAKALADRTRQTEEEVQKLEKIKKELQVLDGQFSQDVSVLRKKIDQACLSYSEAEKHYLKVEKEFLQAKIQLQKEKDKKELLTEHLCALITHNETRKAQKLETLMLELASNRKNYVGEGNTTVGEVSLNDQDHDSANVVDGVEEKTGKMVEMNGS